MSNYNKSDRRKNVGSILCSYYNLERENNCNRKENHMNSLSYKDQVTRNDITDEDKYRKLKTDKGNTNDISKEMNSEVYIDELDKKSSEFNVNDYFKKLLEKSSLEELIHKSKKIEKEIKQNDSFMQSLVYENYSKFIDATDTIVLLKKNFKNVKEKIKNINDHLTYIDDNSNLVSSKVSENFEKIENLIQIKKLLNDINIIMKIPKNMFSLIIQRKYINSLKLFIEAVPFFYKNQHFRVFQNLYLDCDNLANIACYMYLKELKGGKIDRGKAEHSRKSLQDETGSREEDTELGEQDEKGERNNPIFFDKDNLENSFHILHSHVGLSEQIVSCLYLVLAYGEDKKNVRNMYIQNRIMALRYLLQNIFSLNNYVNFGAKEMPLAGTALGRSKLHNERSGSGNETVNGNENGNDHENIHGSSSSNIKVYIRDANDDTCSNELYNKIFENILELSFKYLVNFFFGVIENFEEIFLSEGYSNNKASTEKIFFLNGKEVKPSEAIPYITGLINNLNLNIREKSRERKMDGTAERLSSTLFPSSYDPNAKWLQLEEEEICMSYNPFNKVRYDDVFNLWDTVVDDDDKKMMESLTKSFFNVLLKLTVDLIYMFNPPIQLIVLSLNKLIVNVKNYEARKSSGSSSSSSSCVSGSTSALVMIPFLSRFIKKTYYIVLKLRFYNLCFTNNLNLTNFLNLCNKKDLNYVLDDKNELGHNVLLSLCLTFMDLSTFYEQVQVVNTHFYFKNIINFVIIYFIFLTKFINSFIYHFVCVYDRKDMRCDESKREEANKEQVVINNVHVKDCNYDAPVCNKRKKNIQNDEMCSEGDITIIENKCINMSEHMRMKFVNDKDEEEFYMSDILVDEYSDDSYVDNEKNTIKYKNIYLTSYDCDGDGAKRGTREKVPSCSKHLSYYLYNGIHISNTPFQNILRNTKKYMKMDYEQFFEQIIERQNFEAKKNKKIYFLLSLVSIFQNFKEEGISKIFSIIVDMYKEGYALVNDRRKICLSNELKTLLYEDVYSFFKEDNSSNEEGEECEMNTLIRTTNGRESDKHTDRHNTDIDLDTQADMRTSLHADDTEWTWEEGKRLGFHLSVVDKSKMRKDSKDIKNGKYTKDSKYTKDGKYTKGGKENDEINASLNANKGDLYSKLSFRKSKTSEQHEGKSNTLIVAIKSNEKRGYIYRKKANNNGNDLDRNGNSQCALMSKSVDEGNVNDKDGSKYDDMSDRSDMSGHSGRSSHDGINSSLRGMTHEGRKKKKIEDFMSGETDGKSKNIPSKQYYSDDDFYSEKNEKEMKKYALGICNFVRYKFHEKYNELMNLFISYYINKISHNIKTYIQNGKWVEGEEVKLVSNNFIYLFKNIHKIYSTLTLFFDRKIKGSSYTLYELNELYVNIVRELERICKTSSKEQKFTSNVMHNINLTPNDKKQISQNVRDNKSSSVSTNISTTFDTNVNVNIGRGNILCLPGYQRNIEMYMYKLYMLKMENYKKNIPLKASKIILVIIKILFKNYTEYVRNAHFNEYRFYKLKIDFFFYFHCLKYYIPVDDENVLFVILDEVLINANDRICGLHRTDDGRSVYRIHMLDDIGIDTDANVKFILRNIRRR
ncbi:vacuolar protein sorting-associated protein 51 [Plasmodium brasilianum]|uniref:Vacuolar protein sorting-associated protein 51 n=1 Tax=Plasmodium brasilianum TaxID=5824 RepID=A0ACB9YEN3_PLABR|nr:vacuolar protein sorting-associated protein 51 [Plasmodium brasilianum]